MRHTRCRAAAFLLTATACAVQASGQAALDLLAQPAQIAPRAAQSVMLAVARAGDRLVAVGERGIAVVTDDNGAHWRQARVPVSVTLTALCFVSPREGWAVGHGGVVLHTQDGGEQWTLQLEGKRAAQIALAATVAAESAGQPDAAKRKQAAQRLVADGPDKPLFDVRFADAQNGLVVGAYGLAFATQDGGRSWKSLMGAIDNPRGMHLYSIAARGDEWFVVGEQGTVLRSEDGGQRFARLASPYQGTFFGALTGSAGEFVVFGLRGNAFWSADSGKTWQRIATDGQSTLTAGARLADGALVLMDESGRVLLSRDAGKHFEALAVPGGAPLAGVAQASDGRLMVGGVRGLASIALGKAVPVAAGTVK
jgi:photosystem II stability/assembly factor-like uncharacterized protein